MPTSTGAYYEFDPSGDHTYTVHWAIYRLWSVWLHYTPRWIHPDEYTGRAKARWDRKDFDSKQVGWAFHNGTLHWRVWKSPDSWSRADGWRNSHFNPKDWLLGRMIFSEDDLQVVRTTVAMPEGKYPVEVKLQMARWTRPRGFFGIGDKTMRRAHVEILGADGEPSFIPVPGKGENSWDCGEDGHWGVTLPASSVSEAVAGVVEGVLRDRERYGGSIDWRPSSPRALP